MRAAVFLGAGQVAVEERPLPRPEAGEVLVRVEACGICGTDLGAYATGMYPPGLIPGHEYSGEVVEPAGPFAAGQMVTGNSVSGCGNCRACRAGRPNLCREAPLLGVTRDGALAEYVSVPLTTLEPLPPGLDPVTGAFAEPLAAALRGLLSARPRLGESAVVLGAGPLGLLVVQLARLAGLRPLVVVEPRPSRAALARGLGADLVVEGGDAFGPVLSGTGGHGADLVLECAGVPATVQLAGSLVRPGGRVAVLGICLETVGMNFLPLSLNEVEFVTAYVNAGPEFRLALDLLGQGRVEVGPLISREVPLEAVGRVFEELHGGATEDVKVVVRPGASA